MWGMNAATVYDAVNAVIFAPWGGSGRLRQALIDAVDVRPGHRVLELGCGTGQVTVRLVAAGAEVVAVDALPEMLDRARRRAPAARFIRGDALTVDVGRGYDRVVLSFVLHNFDVGDRVRLLRRAVTLAPAGLTGVLDWATPNGRLRGLAWRRFLTRLEPSPAVGQLLDGALDSDLASAGLQLGDRRRALGGRAQILVLSPR